MNSKLANISKWVFGALALVTVVLAVLFYLNLESDGRTNMILNWGYVLILLSLVSILCSVIVSVALKGFNLTRSVLITVIVAAIMAVISFIISNGWVERGLNFFYLILLSSIVVIIYSVIKSALK
jgi:drug/metabolite transporter (DMT)-like permease